MVTTDYSSMRYWTRLIIAGLIFLVLGWISFLQKTFAQQYIDWEDACKWAEFWAECAAYKEQIRKDKEVQDDLQNLDSLKSQCNMYGNTELCDRVKRAESEDLRNAQWEYQWSKAEKIDNCYKRGYSKLYCDCKITKKWIYLNTQVPFVWEPDNPKCLVPDGTGQAWANVLTALTKILMTFVLIGGFGALVRAWVMIASSWWEDGRKTQWMKLIKAVVIAFALLWSLWVILRFINPNFFT